MNRQITHLWAPAPLLETTPNPTLLDFQMPWGTSLIHHQPATLNTPNTTLLWIKSPHPHLTPLALDKTTDSTHHSIMRNLTQHKTIYLHAPFSQNHIQTFQNFGNSEYCPLIFLIFLHPIWIIVLKQNLPSKYSWFSFYSPISTDPWVPDIPC